jgi:hypothetical protein
MANDPFTIRIFVPDGDPEGVKIIDRMNWTGSGISFPREKWKDVSPRQYFDHAGVYILVGYAEDATDDDPTKDVPTIYIGEGDGIRNRIDSHYANKDFWTWGIAFISTNRGLNKAHAQWLEYALVDLAKGLGQCKLDNGNVPQEPALTEAERADTAAFLREIRQILPLVGLRAFSRPRAVAAPKTALNAIAIADPPIAYNGPDTVVVPAWPATFKKTFIGENCWYAIRISGGMLEKIRWIAAYQSAPVSAITHVAPVDHIEPYGDGKKYKLVFSEPAKSIGPVPFADAALPIVGPRYTTHSQLLAAKKLTDLWPNQ